MISIEFEKLVKRSFVDSLKLTMDDHDNSTTWQIKEQSVKPDNKESECIFLTLSSHLFRIITVLHYSPGDELNRFVERGLNEKSGNINDEKVLDYLFEICNFYVGAMKRDLQRAVPSLGMSTPNLLTADSAQYISVLKIDMQHHASIKELDKHIFSASFYLSAYGELNVDVIVEEETAEAGELEFF